MVGSGLVWMVCSLLMLTTSRGSLREAPDWSESLSVMMEAETPAEIRAEILLIDTNLK